MLTFEEFLVRAKRAGCIIESSGHITFISKGAITVRHNGHSGQYALKRDAWRSDADFERTSGEGASRALKLSRK